MLPASIGQALFILAPRFESSGSNNIFSAAY